MRHINKTLAPLLLATGSIASAPIFAQLDGANPLMLEEVIVTARKRTESLQDVPISISAFDDAALRRRNIQDLQDVSQSTPGLDYENFPSAGLSTAPTIRGMSQTFTTSRIQNTAVFLDGVYLQRQSMVNPGLLDMQRIEVVKGPQSALYGRNAFAGAINYVSKTPGDEFEAELTLTAGNGKRQDLMVSLGGPVIADKLSLRGSYAISDFNGHTDNHHPFANVDVPGFGTDDKVGGWENEAYSFSALFKPTERIEISASYYRTEQKREPQSYYNLKGAREFAANQPNGPFGPPPETFLNCLDAQTTAQVGPFSLQADGNHLYCGALPYEAPVEQALVTAGYLPAEATSIPTMVDPRSSALDAVSKIFTAGFYIEISDNMSLQYQFSDVKHEALDASGLSSNQDSLIGSTNGFGFFYSTFNANPRERLKSQSHELRLDWGSSDDRFSGRLGLYGAEVEDSDYGTFYFIEACNSEANCSVPVNEAPLVAGVPPFLLGGAPFVGHAQPGDETNYEDKILAVFGDLTWQINDAFSLTVEARYTQEDKEIERLSTTFGFPAATDDAGNPISSSNDTDFSFFTPKLTFEWRPSDYHMAYFSAAKGVKTGGFNSVDFDVNPQQAIYDEEENVTYELGSKNQFLDGRLTLNGSIYYIDWSDIQATEAADSSNPFATDVIGNSGDATVTGLEIDGVILFGNSFFVDFGLSVNNPEYDNGTFVAAVDDGSRNIPCDDVVCSSTGDVSGNQLQRTAKQQFNLGLNYRRTVFNNWEFNARLDGNHRSKMYATPLNVAHNDSRTLYNASLNLNHEQWDISLWGKNITDEEYVANSFFLTQFTRYIVARGAGRTFGLTAKYMF